MSLNDQIRERCEAREDFFRRQRTTEHLLQLQQNELEEQRKQLSEKDQQISEKDQQHERMKTWSRRQHEKMSKATPVLARGGIL